MRSSLYSYSSLYSQKLILLQVKRYSCNLSTKYKTFCGGKTRTLRPKMNLYSFPSLNLKNTFHRRSSISDHTPDNFSINSYGYSSLTSFSSDKYCRLVNRSCRTTNNFYTKCDAVNYKNITSVSCGQLRKLDSGLYVKLKGRITVQNINKFAQLRDNSGSTQIQIPDLRTDLLKRISNIPNESIVTVVGTVQARPINKINMKLNTGEIEVHVSDIEEVILNTKRKLGYSYIEYSKRFGSGKRMIQRHFSTIRRLTNDEFSRCNSKELVKKFLERTHTCDDLTVDCIGEELKLCGWLDENIRQNRFLTFRDGFGSTQLVVPHEKEDEFLEIIKKVNLKKVVVEVVGTLCSRRRPAQDTKTGSFEVVLKSLKVLYSDQSEFSDSSKSEEEQNKSKIRDNSDDNVKIQNTVDEPNKKSCMEHVNDYTTRTHTCGELRSSHVGKEVNLCGWVEFVRMNKFILLRDTYGTTQIVVDMPDQNNSVFTNLHLESILSVTGVVCLRPFSQIAKHLATGEIEVSAKNIHVVNKARAKLPFQIRDYNKANDKILNRYRYLALRYAELQNNLRLRSEMLFKMREFLIKQRNFVEVETPTLFKKTPGGAQEFIVPTHFKNKFYSLVQSPQQLKQLLMVGSMDRYFQIARCYRDERTNTERQPEFTQLDIELSFTNVEGVIKLTEDILAATWPANKNRVSVPFPRINYKYSLENFGSDKPCLIDKFLIKNIQKCIDSESSKSTYLFVIPDGKGHYGKLVPKFDALSGGSEVKIYTIKATTVEKLHQVLNKILPGFQPLIFESLLPVKDNDLVVMAVGPKQLKTLKMLGQCRHQTIDTLNLINELNEKGIYEFFWVVDFPLFDENEVGEITSAHHPFTQPHPADVGLIPYEAIKARALAYDLVLNGSEIGGGSIRIHNSELQATVLKLLGLPEEDFSHLLEALQMGCPPHGGIALGLDRLIAILCNRKTIKDVIAFPKGTEGQDIMSGCPNEIPLADKKRYHIYAPDDDMEETSPYRKPEDEEL